MDIPRSHIRRALAELTRAVHDYRIELARSGRDAPDAEKVREAELVSVWQEAKILLRQMRDQDRNEAARVLERTPINELKALLDVKIQQERDRHEQNDHHLGGKVGR